MDFERDIWSECEVASLVGWHRMPEVAARGIMPANCNVYTREQVQGIFELGLLKDAQRLESARESGKPYADTRTFCIGVGGREPIHLGNTICFKLFAVFSRRLGHLHSYHSLKLSVWSDDLTEDETVARTVRRLRDILKQNNVNDLILRPRKKHVALLIADTASPSNWRKTTGNDLSVFLPLCDLD